MMVSVNKAWGDNLILAFDDGGVVTVREVMPYGGDLVSLNEDICVAQYFNTVVFCMLKDTTAFEKNCLRRHCQVC